MKQQLIIPILGLLFLSSCVIIQPGEIGVRQRLGKLSNSVNDQGIITFNPITTKIIRASIQTNNLELSLNLPSKEGLSINSIISILYRLEKGKAPNLIRTYGLDYESIISNIFRSASADVCAQFFAKDMHSGMRAEIEQNIKEKMNKTLENQGIVIEAVLMKSIQLPDGLAESIVQKLQAEQNSMRMKFILDQERQEAERKIIEAQGTRDAQKILSEGLTDQIIKLKSIDAFIELSKSNNAKVIVTDGKTPMLIDNK
jgi:regulator of protease activity HflC (stomatin/prohibitin superfamily)